MTNEQILKKMDEDMKMRGFSHWTEESYRNKAKHVMKYFKKPLEELRIEELREFLLKYLKEEKNGVIIDIWTHLMRGCIIMYTNLKGVCQKWQKEKYTMKILKR